MKPPVKQPLMCFDGSKNTRQSPSGNPRGARDEPPRHGTRARRHRPSPSLRALAARSARGQSRATRAPARRPACGGHSALCAVCRALRCCHRRPSCSSPPRDGPHTIGVALTGRARAATTHGSRRRRADARAAAAARLGALHARLPVPPRPDRYVICVATTVMLSLLRHTRTNLIVYICRL